jgi:threonylcarbamoyladenosine tRNA methylthiotransferase MtaB
VQDGCDYSCTFCTIPLARGKSRSDTIENVTENAKKIAASGVKEIVLTGVNIGDFGYGPELPEKKRKREDFFELVQALEQVEGISRYRISSIEPNLLKNEIISFVASSQKFAPHFHMPLQSGSDSILAQMKRRYRSDLYADRVSTIKKLMPHACIGVDVIVGFPGETEAHFLETYDFLNKLDISYLHVFTYSERENTEAASMANPVPLAERKRRNKMLRILSAKKLRAFYETNKGSVLEVLFEHENKNGFIYGYTENYVRVKYPYDPAFCNTRAKVDIVDFDEEGNMHCRLTEREAAFKGGLAVDVAV